MDLPCVELPVPGDSILGLQRGLSAQNLLIPGRKWHVRI